MAVVSMVQSQLSQGGGGFRQRSVGGGGGLLLPLDGAVRCSLRRTLCCVYGRTCCCDASYEDAHL